MDFTKSKIGQGILLALISLLVFSCSTRQDASQGETADSVQLEAHFKTPPDSVKPWVYWYWLSDNISADGISRDLEMMSRVGIGEAFIGNIGLKNVAYGNIPVFSPGWWQLTRHAFDEGARVGVKLGLFNCPGWSQSGGPWIKPGQAMRYLVHRDWVVTGPAHFSRKLSMPYDYFKGVAVQAFPAPAGDGITLSDSLVKAVRTLPALPDASMLADGDTSRDVIFPEHTGKLVVTLDARAPFTARSLSVFPGTSPFKADCLLEAGTDGNWHPLARFVFDRSKNSLNVGPMPYAPVTVGLRGSAATHYRLSFSNIRGRGSLAEVRLSSSARLAYYVEKQLGKMHPTPHPMWDAYQWPSQPEPVDKSTVIDRGHIINLTDSVAADGTLSWDVPAGTWVIERTGMTTTGVTNGPAAPEATGLEVDKMNPEALKVHFDAFVGRVLDSLSPSGKKAFAHVVEDSYETGSENWTDGFRQTFRHAYGYDPLRWFPVLAGRVVGSVDESNRFLWDLRRLVATRVAYDYVGELRKLSAAHGLKSWLENYGHWGFPSEFLMYGGQSDNLSGEFWAEGDLGSIELRDASSAAHIYGKRQVWAESWTAAGRPFMRYPATLKKRGDWAFTEGINHMLLHVSIEQAYDSLPGLNAWFGTEFNRNNTWFPYSKVWIDYLRRCMFMLQRGHPVGDVCYFIGEDAPKMTGIRDPALPAGYSYDYINAEVIEQRLSVQDGRLVLPEGVAYRVLVLPPEKTMRPELLHKISQLVKAGAVVVGPPPVSSPSLQGYPAADSEVVRLAAAMWQDADSSQGTRYGKGRVYRSRDLQQVLSELGVAPDVRLPAGVPILYVHRQMSDADIYFLTNQSDSTVRVTPTFRIRGRAPELWNPVTGAIRPLPNYHEDTTGITVPLEILASQSWFVVFRHSSGAPVASAENFPAADTLATLTGPWTVRFDTAMRGPHEPVVFDSLGDWSVSNSDSIRYYAGSALYRDTFTLEKVPSGVRLYLNLGSVRVLAHVRVNGKDAGGVWTDPWQVDVTDYVKPGVNVVEVSVVNLWVNRLIGDSRIPAAQRRTWAPVNPFKPDSPLEPSGLLGPVTLQAVRYAP